MTVRHFIWDLLDGRVDGGTLNAMAREMIARDPMIASLELYYWIDYCHLL